MIQTSEQINELATALAKAQAKIETIQKNQKADAGSYEYQYADLAAVLDGCRPHLAAEGIAVIQAPYTDDDGAIGIATRLVHSSGQWLQSNVGHNMTLKRWQDLGGALTYLRRYAYSAMIGVASEEDSDGKDTGSLKAKPSRKRQPEPEPEPEPTWTEKAERIASAVKSAATSEAVTQCLKVFSGDLQWLHDHKPHYYERLMEVAQERERELENVTPIAGGQDA